MKLAAISGVNGPFSDDDIARVRELALAARAKQAAARQRAEAKEAAGKPKRVRKAAAGATAPRKRPAAAVDTPKKATARRRKPVPAGGATTSG
jgi:hypothetical protein